MNNNNNNNNLLHVVDSDEGLLAHTAQGTRVPQRFLTMKIKKNWSKIHRISKNNFVVIRNNRTKLFHVMSDEPGMIIWVQLSGNHLPKIWDGKNVQNSARFRTTLDFDRECLRNGSR